MSPRRRERRVIAAAGAAALVAVGLNLAFSAVAAHRRRKRRELPGFTSQVNLSASDIKRLADRVIAKSKETYDAVGAVPLDKVSFSNVIAPLAELDAQLFPLVQACVLPRMVSPSDDVRRSSAEAEKRLDFHFLQCRQREDVYCVIKAFMQKGERIGLEATRFVQCMVREFERNGAKLTQSKKTEMDKLKSHIDDLSLKYIQSLNDSTKFLLLSEEELAGMPLEFLKELENTDGKRKVLLTSYHVTPILEHCKVGSTRNMIAVAYGQKGGKENIAILEKLVQLRHRLARLLGYPNYSDYAIEPRMPRTSRKVLEFLEEMSEQLNDQANRELSILKDLKMKEEGDAQFGVEDLLYYMKRAEELKVDLDIGEIKQYFPVDLVISGMLKTFQDLFALRFEEIKDAETWHDTVRLFSVWDASSSDLLGYFFLDTFSREGKYSHTCVMALQNGCLCSNGTRKVPVAVLLSQCPKECDRNSTLLRFPEVVRIFHEFSHVVHHISNRATFSRFSALQVEGDFAEIPSLLLENWCYENISLKMMSGFHQDITKSITSEACQSLKRRRDMFAGLKLKQEILLCLVDQIIHTSENVDIDDLIKDLHPKVMLGIPLLEGNSPASCFPRIAIGYDAVCYSYIWSEVFAADLFASKFKDDLLNQHVGLRFRNKVLAPGGSKNPVDIITDYLGREPSLQAFIQSKTRNIL
ncbi:probable thimet oligopeptidase [Oryza brachyantha]|uniref:Peptidase M3A/M3B catalytic domain-containing protein n=1 Tax=Oryza brachyantha TaxID=4533 RepID=J3L6V1_ORYBR|nr:probable thimet oligopeptidase [Oryza brachyantha]